MDPPWFCAMPQPLRSELTSTIDTPHSDSLVPTGAHDIFPIGRERRRIHALHMACKSLLALRHRTAYAYSYSLVVAGTRDFLPIGRERRHHHTRMACKSLLAKLQLRPVFLLDKLGPWESSCWTAKLSRIKIAAVGPSASQRRQPHSSSGGSSCNNANEVCITLALSGPGYEDINIGISDLACQAIIIILPLVLAL